MKKRNLLGLFAMALMPWHALSKDNTDEHIGEKVEKFAKAKNLTRSLYKEQIWALNQAGNNEWIIGYRGCGATWLCGLLAAYYNSIGKNVLFVIGRRREESTLKHNFALKGVNFDKTKFIYDYKDSRGFKPDLIINNRDFGARYNNHQNYKDQLNEMLLIHANVQVVDFSSYPCSYYTTKLKSGEKLKFAPSEEITSQDCYGFKEWCGYRNDSGWKTLPRCI